MTFFKPILSIVVLSLGLGQAVHAAPKVEPRADQLLRKMSDFLSAQKRFSFKADNELQAVTKAGQKLEFDADSQVSVERPNHIRSDRQGELATNLSLYYDGKDISLYGRDEGLYATTPAPDNIDQAIDFARTQLDLEAPAADLLYSNPYKALMEDVVSGTYVGKAQLAGTPVHHLAFRGNETDWQIWIEDGDRPLPRKFVISSKKVKLVPEFSVELRDWNLSPSFSEDVFGFSPPQDAARIQFAGVPASKSKKKKG